MRGSLLPMTVACALLAGCLPSPPAARTGAIEGKAVFRRARAAGAMVAAVSSLGVTGEERRFSATADAEGTFRLDLPPGSYFLSFFKEPDIYGFFGGNPVTVLPDVVSQVVLRGVAWKGGTVLAPGDATSIEGTAHLDGAPVAGGLVQVFLDAATRFKGPGYASAATDAGGRFTVDLPPGRYYVIARRRRGTERIGPLNVGDQYAWYPGNPVLLPEGRKAVIDLPYLEVEKDPARVLSEASRGTMVRGTVRDARGRPLAGVWVCLYLKPEPMGMPAFASEATDAEGRFTIRVTAAGPYYLVARAAIGRPLEPNEYVAFYRGPSGHLLTVEAGRDVAGIELVWEGR